jgi:hypothetical protein
MKTCDVKECSNPASWVPVLLLRPKWWKGKPARGTLAIHVCDTCKPKIKVEDCLSDEGWNKILGDFRKLGRADPHRSSTALEFVRPDHPEVQELHRSRPS